MKMLLAAFTLSACTAVVSPDAGCASYEEARTVMPQLDLGPVSQWVAALDSRMTGTCVR